MKTKKSRLYLLDAIRGFSVLSMILYHLSYDIYDFGIYPLGIGTLPFEIWRMTICCVFIAISGICAEFSRNKIRRAFIVIACAYIVTAATYFFDNDFYVLFGILHCLGFSALIYALLKKAIDRVPFAPAVWLLLFIILYAVKLPYINVPHLYFLGLPDTHFSSSDYYPLIPYMFLYFFGTSLSGFIKDKRLPNRFYSVRARFLEFFGRHALIIYLLHQIVLIGIMMLITK